MDLIKAKEALESYYEGETSLQQELELRQFLLNYQGNDTDFMQAKKMFEVLTQNKTITSSIEMDQITEPVKARIIRWVRLTAAAAAVLIIPIVLTVWMKSAPQPVVYAYVDGKPITSKEQAIKETQLAMLALSGNMAKGTEPLKQIQIINKPVELLTFKK